MPVKSFLFRFALVLAVLWPAGSAMAQADDTVIIAHGIAMHGDLKYPADFTHFEYANPAAPKGGSVVRSVQGHSIRSIRSFPRATPKPTLV